MSQEPRNYPLSENDEQVMAVDNQEGEEQPTGQFDLPDYTPATPFSVPGDGSQPVPGAQTSGDREIVLVELTNEQKKKMAKTKADKYLLGMLNRDEIRAMDENDRKAARTSKTRFKSALHTYERLGLGSMNALCLTPTPPP